LLRVWLVVDPGKLTGFSWLNDGIGRILVGGELEHFEFLDYAERCIQAHWLPPQPGHATFAGVVCESFRVNNTTARKISGGRLWATEQIGVLRQRCRTANISYVEQTPSDAKSFADDAKLKKMGWFKAQAVGEAGHRRDSARHALLFGIRNNIIDPRELL
jgi:hypothetical protein